jgi:hypothetical protein
MMVIHHVHSRLEWMLSTNCVAITCHRRLGIGQQTHQAPRAPGVPRYTQEAYGSVSASADTVTVTEYDYWGGSANPLRHNGFSA